VLVCGDVINDILVQTRGPLVHGDDNEAVIRTQPGGSAANQAAWMGRLGLDVVFAGRAGAADAGFHQRELARFGVRAHIAADDRADTGSIVVLVGPDGERTMITDRGANLRLQAGDVPADFFDGVALLHLTGYSFFAPAPRQVALGLIARARRLGVPYTVDPSSAAFLRGLAPDAFLDWTSGASVCFPNRDEAVVLAGAVEAMSVQPLALAAGLARNYGAVALKLGGEGAVLATADAPPVRIPALPATVRDTTGAGDAFCAGFLVAWLAGAGLIDAARAGAEAAARAVSRLGGRPW
jgi:sugar/nucleoside kinase (ribokinase family)